MSINLITNDIANLSSSTAAIIINNNFQSVKEALEKAFNKEGGVGNTVETDLDMNDNDLLNVSTINGTLVEDIINKIGEKGDKGDQGDVGPAGSDGTNGVDGVDGLGVPAGGTTGQILAKASATDNDTEWIDLTSADPIDVTVSTTDDWETTIAEAPSGSIIRFNDGNYIGTDVIERRFVYLDFRSVNTGGARINFPMKFRHCILFFRGFNWRILEDKRLCELVNCVTTVSDPFLDTLVGTIAKAGCWFRLEQGALYIQILTRNLTVNLLNSIGSANFIACDYNGFVWFSASSGFYGLVNLSSTVSGTGLLMVKGDLYIHNIRITGNGKTGNQTGIAASRNGTIRATADAAAGIPTGVYNCLTGIECSYGGSAVIGGAGTTGNDRYTFSNNGVAIKRSELGRSIEYQADKINFTGNTTDTSKTSTSTTL